MKLVGEDVVIVQTTDPTKKGLTGRVVLETANTILLDSKRKRVRVEKKGARLVLVGSKTEVDDSQIIGRLEDRLRSGKR